MNLSRISKKTPHVDYRQTLPSLHASKLKEFADERETLTDKEILLGQLINQYNSNKCSIDYLTLYETITKLQTKVKRLRGNIDEYEYLSKAAPFLCEYYNETNKNKEKLTEIEKNNEEKLDKMVKESDPRMLDDLDDPEPDKTNLNNLTKFIKQDIYTTKGKICDNYKKTCLMEINHKSRKEIEKDNNKKLICECGTGRVVIAREAIAVCKECGSVEKYRDETGPQEFRPEVEILSPFAYKRINHFKEWIAQIQARESTTPSDEVIDQLLKELKKERIVNNKDITPKRIKGYLKKLKLNKQYEHVSSIIDKLCGIPPPIINRELENKLIKMFEEIQGPFEKICPPDRNNFLSYSYTLHKMCELLGEDQLLPCFPYLKSREKLYIQDSMWKRICKILHWSFYPSL